MLRILHVVTDMRRGGLESMLMNYYRVIDREKIQFDFLTHRDYLGDYGEEIINLGGKIYHIMPLNPFSKKYKNELVEFFNTHQEYKIIHVHQDCMSSVVLKIAKEQGIKIRIAHSHSSSQDKNLKYLIKLFYKKYIPKYATDLMACGLEAGKWMFKDAEFIILNNAIDAEKYRYNEEIRIKMRKVLKIEKNELVIGHVGRFSPVKNQLFLLEIYKEILKNQKSKLLMIGDGQMKNEILKKIEYLGIASDVILTGVRTDVADLMQAMDVFVLPSLYEGLGIVGVEAQASGLPCVFSENIPDEAVMTKLVKKISLNAPKENWVAQILDEKDKKRVDSYNEICKAGYDIRNSVERLQRYYLELYSRGSK